ncbi:uncharacterized protein LOC113352709 [Papaver somniferum]|uniref:uncharacterized protein LOC113352709 n=1 Tax=Papaver somniferum TaxID=3469 RepID=UPI000E6F5929|nr:uncharacterized protein LOC113352709 [Papaver somniferum]
MDKKPDNIHSPHVFPTFFSSLATVLCRKEINFPLCNSKVSQSPRLVSGVLLFKLWRMLVIFSNANVPGEGKHKIMLYVHRQKTSWFRSEYPSILVWFGRS